MRPPAKSQPQPDDKKEQSDAHFRGRSAAISGTGKFDAGRRTAASNYRFDGARDINNINDPMIEP
jgi:hypothetical protein